jgi:hypothetical protein
MDVERGTLYTPVRASITRFIRGVKGGGGGARPLRKQAICLHNVPPPCIISLFYTPFTAGKRGVVDGGGGGRGEGVSFINQENARQWLPGTAFTSRSCLLVCLTTFSLNCRIGLYTQHTSSAFKNSDIFINLNALIKKKIKFSSNIRKIRVEQLQSHI